MTIRRGTDICNFLSVYVFIEYNRYEKKYSLEQKEDMYLGVLKSYFYMAIQLKNSFIVKRNKYIHLALLKNVAVSTLRKEKKSTGQDQLASAIVI